MKKWTMVIATIIIFISSLNNIYAVQDLDEYTEELPNDGRIILKFTTQDQSSPVAGVKVEIFYEDENEEIDIRNMEEMEKVTVNLVSDSNGIVIINSLPYGLYRYKIVSVPTGFVETEKDEYFTIDLMNKTARIDIEIEQEIHMDEVNEDEEIENNVTEEENKEEKEQKEQEQEKEKVDENVDSITEEIKVDSQEEEITNNDENNDTVQSINIEEEINIETENEDEIETPKVVENTIVKEVITENKISKIEDDILQKSTEYVRNRIEKPKEDMIKAFMEYRISDTIKVAIDTIGTTRDTYAKFLIDLPDTDDKNKKLKRVNKVIATIKDIHEES